jgi:hypothetical protein
VVHAVLAFSVRMCLDWILCCGCGRCRVVSCTQGCVERGSSHYCIRQLLYRGRSYLTISSPTVGEKRLNPVLVFPPARLLLSNLHKNTGLTNSKYSELDSRIPRVSPQYIITVEQNAHNRLMRLLPGLEVFLV